MLSLLFIQITANYSDASSPAPSPAPFFTQNTNPFTTVYGTPPMQPILVLSKGQREARLSLDIANNSIMDDAENESMVLDGETYRTSLFLRFGLHKSWELGIELPYYQHKKSVFDDLVDDWHDLVGLSTPNRDDFDHNRILFQYSREGQAEVTLNSSRGGPGDVRFSIARQIPHRFDFPTYLTARFGVQLPTGDASSLTGSRSTDVSLDASLLHVTRLLHRPMSLFARFGIVIPGSGSVLATLRRDKIFYANAGIGWQLAPRFSLKAQLDGHGAVFDSQLDPLGRDAWQIASGASWSWSQSSVLDVSILENFRRDPVPDVGAQLSFRHRF